MRIFLAGARGAVGRRLASLLGHAGLEVTGTTRTAARIPLLREFGVVPVVVDVFDAGALAAAVVAARPEIVIHQLTDLPSAPGTPGYPAAQEANRRLRIEGTRNLMQAARMAGVRRAVAQSIAFIYAPGEGIRDEDDPLDLAADGVRALTVQGIIALEHEVLATAGIDGVVLRYGYFYGPGTWYDLPPKPPSVHVDAAAHAAMLAVSKGGGSTISPRTATSCRARRRSANWASIRRSGCPDRLSADKSRGAQPEIRHSPCDKVARRANHFGFSEVVSSSRIKNKSLAPSGKSSV